MTTICRLELSPSPILGLLAIDGVPVTGVSANSWSGIWTTLQIEISVHLGGFHLFPDLRTYDIDLLLRVAQNAREESVGERFETLHDLEVVPGADFFLPPRVSVVVEMPWRGVDVITRCLSAGQVPTGHTCFSAATSSKPASFSQPSRRGPGHGSMPLSRETLMNVVLKCLEACSGVRDPSGEFHSKSRSMHSTQPPGLVCLVELYLAGSASVRSSLGNRRGRPTRNTDGSNEANRR